MTDESRKEFEAWFTRKFYTIDPIAKESMFASWQASRAALQEKPRREVGLTRYLTKPRSIPLPAQVPDHIRDTMY